VARPLCGTPYLAGNDVSPVFRGDLKGTGMETVSWTYDFVCAHSLEEIRAAFKGPGRWHWELCDRTIYGNYLNCRPEDGVRLQLHEYPGG
jgi:hypothetical protein